MPFTLAHFRAWARKLTLDNDQPFILEPFQEAFVVDLFARQKDGWRFTELWFVIPEENGKTTLLAALLLYHIEFMPGAFAPVAAASRDQAETIYRQAEGFVLRSPRLNGTTGARRGLMVCQPGYRKIRLREQKEVRIQIFAADADTADSVIPTFAVIDELHRHKNMELYRTWTGKLRKRGGQLGIISTGGEPGSEFEQTRTRLRESGSEVERRPCCTRAAGESFVIHDWSVPEKADVEDLAVVKNANPFSGITIESLRRKRNSPTMTLAHWVRFTCNRSARADGAAIGEREWAERRSDVEIPKGTPIALGFDVGWKWDTTAAVPLWIRDQRFRLFGPAIILTPPRDGTSLHPDTVKKALLDLHQRTPIATVVMDVTRAEELAAWFQQELGAKVIEHSNGNAQAALDYDRFMEGLREGWIHHSGDAEFTRHAMNGRAHMLPDGHHRFERPSTTRQGGDQEQRVIDALVAAAMVYGELCVAAPSSQDLPPSRSEHADRSPVMAGMRERSW